ncbi:MAG TPA: hypothetical protein RMH26_23675 [Polyangiaceae bacterium LLY-WYZ-15_(1-7)]|nr:hypothetical protein [Polyangiaceae bacterium LLY-WYZ-15_(1-7)]
MRTSLLLSSLLLLTACDAALIELRGADAGPLPTADAGLPMGDAGSAEDDLEARYTSEGQPLLDSRCVACHEADRTGPAFLEAPAYETLFAYPSLVDLDDPAGSRLLTKGAHAGPAWTATEAATVRAWLEAEAAVREPTDPSEPEDARETDPFAPTEGLNVVDLSVVGAGMDGAQMTFVASRTAAGLYLSEVRVYAGAGGVRLVHPVLVVWEEGTPEPDPVDRFSELELRVAPYGSETFGGGNVSLVGFPEEGELSFLFDEVGGWGGEGDPGDPTDPGDPGEPDGCRAVSAFTENARPQLQAFCTGCHGGGNETATAALDMTQVDDGDATAQRAACGQILGVVDPADPTMSSLFRAPDRGSDLDGHPFKFPTSDQLDGYHGALGRWLEME